MENISDNTIEVEQKKRKEKCFMCLSFYWQKVYDHVILRQLHLPDNDNFYYLIVIIISFLSWVTLVLMVSDEMFPSNEGFMLLVMVIASFAVGQIFTVLRMPDLLGMLLTGVAFRTFDAVNIQGYYVTFVACSRDIAMAIILLKAGLGLDVSALKEKAFIVLRLILLPFIAESCGVALIAHYIAGFSVIWSFLLGSISTAVVIPIVLDLKKKGYGERHGLYTLMIASSSLDDIFCVGAVGMCQSIIFNQGDALLQFLQPISIFIGLAYGILWGVFCAILPHKEFKNVTTIRSAFLAFGGIIAVLGSIQLHFPGAGPLACIVSATLANLFWKKQGWEGEQETPVETVFTGMWFIIQPLLFSFIGAEINLKALDGYHALNAFVIVTFGLACRAVACFIALIRTEFTKKEQLFITIAWLSKATAQAVLGPRPLDFLRKDPDFDENSKEFDWAKTIFNTAVFSIIFTTPICSVILTTMGTTLVRKNSVIPPRVSQNQPDHVESELSSGTIQQ